MTRLPTAQRIIGILIAGVLLAVASMELARA